MSLHPDLGDFLDLAEQARGPLDLPFHQLAPAQARALFDKTTEQLRWPLPAGIDSQALSCVSRDGAVLSSRLYRPQRRAGERLPLLVYFHGGGYVVGSLDSHDGVCREFAAGADCAVLSVGYRLAPEHRFPQPLEDGEDVLAWLAGQAQALGVDLERVAFAGDSVGATLACVLAAGAAATGQGLQPRVQVLCYPVADASRRSASMELFAEGYLLESDTLDWFYNHYARTVEDRQDPRFSPLLGTVPAALAPTVIALAGHDPLVDEGRAYAEHLRAAGVPVTVRDYPGLTHDFLRLGSVVSEVAVIYQALCADLNAAWNR
ncbi:alpha/beta hydrolase [Pseudomonas muyukensis]|uniref:Alpha/beta hydrolase n=1 Tax=Pseudomonas muyukensis TaxID=2842357 RepID=A0ABX8M4B1_9PSED|nr:alpha/beta hydrolase [Pseudomonas muyukensis]QXH33936.1 alpha/beta hydrolase [Pseudomonas muyukensis]